MAKPQTVKTIAIKEIELAAAIECHAPGCTILTGETRADEYESYVFLDEPDVRVAMEKLEAGTLEVNVKDYYEKLWYLQEWLDGIYQTYDGDAKTPKS